MLIKFKLISIIIIFNNNANLHEFIVNAYV